MNDILAPTPEKEMKEMKFDTSETFEIKSDGKIFELKISLNEKLMFFKVDEKNTFPKEDFNIYLSLEELGKINRYFIVFETLKEVLESFKLLIDKNNLSIIRDENLIKIKIINPINNREFFINIPKKEKDLKSEINSIIPYIKSLHDKIELLENKLNEIYIYKNDLEEIIKERKLHKQYDLYKSNIINKNEINLLLNWLEQKNPSKIKLLLDSKIDGDLTDTFYKKCSGKYPTIVLVKTTKGRRFGGYSSISWKDMNGGSCEDKNNFIFSLDKQKKYSIKNPKRAIETYYNYFAFGGGSDFLVENKCTSSTNNYNNNSGTYNTTEKYELNGEYNYTVSSYEVYEIEY
jgi:hypothetical protein